jgi:hypothetical protein
MKYESKTRHTQLQGVLPASVFVFVLAFAVFGWGLHSKLSLYRVSSQTPKQSPVAELLCQQERPNQSLSKSPSGPLIYVRWCSPPLFYCSLAELNRGRRVAITPQRLIALKGPSVLRPPPSLG